MSENSFLVKIDFSRKEKFGDLYNDCWNPWEPIGPCSDKAGLC